MAIDHLVLQEALEHVRNLPEIKQLPALLHCLRSILNVVNIAYHGLFVPGRIADDRLLAVTYEKAWQKRYVMQDYFRIDPVEVTARAITEPLDWNYVRFASKEAEVFFADAEHHGVGHNGISFPLIDQQGGRALFSVTSNLRGEDWEDFKVSSSPSLIRIGRALQQRTTMLDVEKSSRALRIPPLTVRETEFLSLYVGGHEIKQIRERYSLSDTAVRDVLNSVTEKLGARSPRHAGYLAVTLGIIPASATPYNKDL